MSDANCLAATTPGSDPWPVPGQRKRKRRQEAARQQHAARTTADKGQWQVTFQTRDHAALRAEVRRLAETGLDESMMRIDMLCGRLVQPTTYRLSQFTADPRPEH